VADPQYSTVLVERDDGITWVTLNRPDKKNATNPTLHREMVAVLDELELDPATGVLVLTGAGDSFSAGQDLKEYFRDLDDKPVERAIAKRDSHTWTWERLYLFPKPTIAMVNGYCFGNAFTPLIACDFAIAADDATFGLSEINWGIHPGGLVSKAIIDTLSYRDALYYAMTGTTFDGVEAARMRLVTRSVPAGDLRAATTELARTLLSKSPAALRATKEALKSVRTMDHVQAFDYLAAKSATLKAADPERSRERALSQFLDEKSFRPGLGGFDRDA
jgi:trans-feruloyl-CoA hydratase/vanillin synthase